MTQLIGTVLFAVGGVLLLVSLASTQQGGRPLLVAAMRRARERQHGLLVDLRRNWDRRLDRILERGGLPKRWSAKRLQQISLTIAGIGGLLAVSTMLEGGGAAHSVMILLLGLAAAWVAPDLLGRLFTLRARSQEIEESIQLLRTLDVYLQNGHTLRAALEASHGSLPYLGPRIKKTLDMWGQGPYRAIDNLEAATSDDSVRLVIAALKQAVDLGPGQLPVFLERENEAIRRSREALQKANQARKPILFTMYLGLPIVGYLVAFMMPFGVMVARSITHIGGPL